MKDIINASLKGTILFILGFIIGSFLDIIFYKIYYSQRENVSTEHIYFYKFIFIFIIQVFTSIYILNYAIYYLESKKSKLFFAFQIGFLASSILLLEDSVKYFKLRNLLFRKQKI